MKNILRLIVGGLTAALFTVAAQAAELAPGAVSVGIAKGDVTYKIAGTTAYLPAPAGTALPQGATVKAGAGSTATLVFASGSVATIRPNSEVEITKFEQEAFSGPVSKKGEPSVSNTELKLIDGEVISNVAKLKKGSQFVVNSPIGAAGVRGTIFSIKIDRVTGAARITVLEGSVNLKASTPPTTGTPAAGNPVAAAPAGQKTEVLITAGQTFDVPPPASTPGVAPTLASVVASVLKAINEVGSAPMTPELRAAIVEAVTQQLTVGAPNSVPDTATIETTETVKTEQAPEKTTTGTATGPTVPSSDLVGVSLN